MITYATRESILEAATGDSVAIPNECSERRFILSGERDESRYGVQSGGIGEGSLVRVDYVADSAMPGIVRVKIIFGVDDSREDNAVTFGARDATTVMGRATANTMGRMAPGQCECGEFHSSH